MVRNRDQGKGHVVTHSGTGSGQVGLKQDLSKRSSRK